MLGGAFYGGSDLRLNLVLVALEKIPDMAIVVPMGIGREIMIQGSSGFRWRGNGRSP